MRMKESAKMLTGSIAVYVIMAACSGTDGSSPPAPASGGTAAGTASEGGAGALPFTNPVVQAKAQILPTTAFTESCDKTTPNPDAGPFVVYAEHAFPGFSAQQLAPVVAIASGIASPYPGSSLTLAAAGYSLGTVNTFVRDGYVAASCGFGVGTTVQEAQYQSVTFIFPQ